MRHKALTVRAPWAWFISIGRKSLEIRKQRTSHRGPLLICAGLQASSTIDAAILAYVTGDQLDAALAAPRGVALCVVDVIDCRPATPEDAAAACVAPADGTWAWVLSDPRPVEQQRVTGKQGFFWVEL